MKIFNALIFLVLLICSCTSNTGTLTITNPTLETINVTFNNKNLTIAGEQHLTQKGLKAGSYNIKIGDEPSLAVKIDKEKTTLIDMIGDNCFIVADYTDQYGEKGTGKVKVAERFVNSKVFTTKNKITAELGEQLPEGIQGHKRITRIHRVDCSWIDNDHEIVEAIANLP